MAGGNETQHAVYDFEGTQGRISLKNAPAENIKSLFGLYEISGPGRTGPCNGNGGCDPETAQAQEQSPLLEERKRFEKIPHPFGSGQRIGLAASNDGVEFGVGLKSGFLKAVTSGIVEWRRLCRRLFLLPSRRGKFTVHIPCRLLL
ncbi:MAG: hypothetical protein R2874_01450 [Desulfobacterales bacterium]